MTQVEISDERADRDAKPAYWIVANDKFLSGWGMAPNRSLYAIAIPGDTPYHVEKAVLDWMQSRSDFQYVRISSRLPRLHDGDHLAIRDIPYRFR